MGGSETNVPKNDKTCVICGIITGKYKLKCCLRNFCSVECFQVHSKKKCDFKSNQMSNEINLDQNISEKHEEIKLENSYDESEQFELTVEEKQALNSNERLSSLLRRNPRLLEMMKFIDNSENKTEALARVMNEDSNGKDKLFAEFTELVAECFGEEFKTYKCAYDSIVSDALNRN